MNTVLDRLLNRDTKPNYQQVYDDVLKAGAEVIANIKNDNLIPMNDSNNNPLKELATLVIANTDDRFKKIPDEELISKAEQHLNDLIPINQDMSQHQKMHNLASEKAVEVVKAMQEKIKERGLSQENIMQKG
ncbi:MAG: hypothetical protein R3D71_03830 [Rickettsiales bacterium]